MSHARYGAIQMATTRQAESTVGRSRMPRRAFLRVAGTLAVTTCGMPLASCGRSGRHPPERPELTLFSRRPASGDSEGLTTFLALYQQNYPGVGIVNFSVVAGT